MGGCSCKQPVPPPNTTFLSQQKSPSTQPSKVNDIEPGTTDTTAEKPHSAKEEKPGRTTRQTTLEELSLKHAGEEKKGSPSVKFAPGMTPGSSLCAKEEHPKVQPWEPRALEEPLLSTVATEAEEKSGTPVVKYTVGLTVVALLVCGVYAQWARVRSRTMEVWLALLHLRLWAVPIWVVLLWATTSVSGPAFIFELNGGILFDQMYGPRKGAIVGMLTCSLGVWLGCVTAFAIGRRFLKQHVEHIVKENRVLHIINDIVTEEGWKFSFLMRLNPMIPFEIFNYAVAMSDISFGQNAFAAIGTLPRVCFEVYLAVSASEVAEDTEEGGKHRGQKIMHMAINLGIGVVLIAATAIYGKLKYDAKVKLDEASPIRAYSAKVKLRGQLIRQLTSSVGFSG